MNNNKFILYKFNYLNLQKKYNKNQKGGTLEDIYNYMGINLKKFNQDNINLIYASIIPNLDEYNLDYFKEQLKSNSINIPIDDEINKPNDDTYLIITSGTNYFKDKSKIIVLIKNIINNIKINGKIKNFIIQHFDIELNEASKLRLIIKDLNIIELISPRYLTYNDVKKLEEFNNHLVIDLAHILKYYKPSYQYGKTYKKVYIKMYNENIPELSDNLNINAFYPGFLDDINNIEFIENFIYIVFINNNIITYDYAGYVKEILLTMKKFINPQEINFIDKYIDKSIIFNYDIMDNGQYFGIPALAKNYNYNFANDLFWFNLI